MERLKAYGLDQRRIEEASGYPGLHLARVVAQYGELYRLVAETGEWTGKVSGKFRHEATGPADYPAVGDFVLTDQPAQEGGNGVIHRVLTRRSAFVRGAAGKSHEAQVVAANVDTVFVCMSLNNDYNLSRLERYLAVVWDSGAVPVILLTKADLCPDLPARMDEIRSVAPGTEVMALSCLSPETCAQLFHYLKAGTTASFIGSSGVGKSTLINLLAKEARFATASVRAGDDRGRHTTTRRELVLLPCGGLVIDTPGMRELAVETADLGRTFGDIEELALTCRFRDCTHGDEPGCEVQKAIREGRLEPRRLANYKKLAREAAYEGLDWRELEAEKLNAMTSNIGGMKNMRKYIRQNDKRKRED